MAADDASNEKPTSEGESRNDSLSELRQAIEVGLNHVQHGRTTDGRDALAQVRARRAFCRGCAGSPLAPVRIGDTIRCALHPDALGDPLSGL